MQTNLWQRRLQEWVLIPIRSLSCVLIPIGIPIATDAHLIPIPVDFSHQISIPTVKMPASHNI